MANFPRAKRGVSLALAMTFGVSCLATGAEARQAYSTIQANIREEAEIEPYAGGKKVGPVHDWELLCKIEGDETLKERVVKSAEEGSLDHVFILACMNLHGKGVEKNQPAAFELFKAAANRGHSNSQNNLGYMFEEGIGTKKDLKQALAWYKKAADYNNPSALCNLGNMYEHGRGVPADVDEALKLYQKSAELGNKTARQNVYGIEFEREGKWKLKGIEVTQATPQPPVADKNAKKAAATQPAAPQKQLTYNPTTALFRNEQLPASNAPAKTETAPAKAEVAAKPADNAPALLTAPATKPATPAKAATPPAVAKVDTKKPVNPTEAVLNALNKPKVDPKAPAAKTAATPVAKDNKDKGKVAAKPAAAEAKKQEVAAAPAAPETKPEEKPEGFVAGTPTLTAILNRLSKGTSLEQQNPDKKDTPAVVAETPKGEAKPAVSEKPAVQEKPADKPKVDEKAKAKKEEKPAPVAKDKKSNDKKTEIASEKPVTLLTSGTEPAKPEEKPAAVAVKREEKPAPKVEKTLAVVAKAEAKPEAKPAEVKKPSSLDTPVTYSAGSKPPAKAEAKPAPGAKPAAAQVAAKPAATTGSAKKADTVLADKGPNRPIRDKWALVIGITDFQDPDIPDLQYSAKDATDFYNYLVKEANFQPDHVRLLLNEQATQRRVLSELGSKFLARVVKPDDLVVLYFSTHGSPSQLDPRGKNYLVASDSDSEDLFATGIEMQKLLDSIQGRVLTDRVLLVMDACHSGFAAPDSKGMQRTGNFKMEDLVQGSGQLVICSSMQDERAWESTRYQNGVFTRKLLDGLRTKGSNTSLVEAFTFLRGAVGDEVQEDRPGAKQTPVLKGKWDGNDLVLATPAYAPQTIPTSVSQNLVTDSRVDLIASAPKAASRSIGDDEDTGAKPSNDSAPRSGVIYLDSQFFSVKGDPKSLAKEYHDAIRNNPSDPDLYFLRAKALIQMEDWHNAMACLSDAIQMSPNRAQYYLGRAYVNFRLGKKVLAEQDLEQARFYDHKMSNNIKFHI